MGQLISACGLYCDECNFYNNGCAGCYAVDGKTFWAVQFVPEKICALYNCAVNKHKYGSCGDCAELPCQIFKDQKEPNSTEEEHMKGIKDRVTRLKGD